MRGATGARTAGPAGGQGKGSRTVSSERDRRGQAPGHKTQLYLADASTGGPASAGAGAVFAALHITALVAGTGSILHDSPERSEVQSGAGGLWLGLTEANEVTAGVLTYGPECAAPGRGSRVEG